jgi:hypothetical protein
LKKMLSFRSDKIFPDLHKNFHIWMNKTKFSTLRGKITVLSLGLIWCAWNAPHSCFEGTLRCWFLYLCRPLFRLPVFVTFCPRFV